MLSPIRKVAAALCVAVLCLASNPLLAQVSISEIRIDQPGTDNDEYFELTGSAGTDLTGMTYLVIGDSTAGGSGVIEAVVDLTGQSIPASGFFVAAESSFTIGTADFTIPLGFENSDNVTHLLVAGFVGSNGDDLDTNDDGTLDSTPWTGLVDLIALIEEDNPPTGTEFHYGPPSIGPDGTFVPGHVMNCTAGFQIGAFDPVGGEDTPGAANSCGVVTVSVTISELRIDQPGGDDNDEYFELAGNPGDSLDGLTYLVIGDGTGGSGTIEAVVDLTGSVVPTSGFFVAAESTFTIGTADLATSLNFENSDNVTHLVVRDFTGNSGDDLDTDDNGTVDVAPWSELVDCIALVETVGSGDQVYCLETVGPDGIFVPGHVFECPGGFEIGAFDPAGGNDTPGAANDCDDPPTTDSALVINEIDYDQPGTDTAEFIEIRNNDAVDVVLDGFSLELVNGTGGVASVYQTINLPAVTLAPGEYFVVCADSATVIGCDLDAINSIQNGSPDAVALVSGSLIIDTVSYEGDTAAPYTEGSGAGLTDPGSGGIGGGNDNKSISRLPDGIDTNMNNVDFAVACATPGAANTTDVSDCPSVAPPNLVINEIDYDQPGADTAEFVEILNSGLGAIDLTGIDLVLVNGNGASVYQTIALPAVTLAGGDYFVVCADVATVANCDLEAINSIQNGAPDAVALSIDGAVIDTVSYEGDTGAPYTEGSGAGLADSNSSGQDFRSIGRFPDGTDTNVNNVDLINTCITPGGPNTSLATGCTPLAPRLEIFEIQGNGLASPFNGQSIRTEDNVVTAIGPDRFAMQTPTARTDGDIDTSDGIIVFTGGAPGVEVGDSVTVIGVVEEFFDLTEFRGGALVEIAPDKGIVPEAVTLDSSVPSPDPFFPSCSFEFECYEGMLVEIANGTVTASNQRFNTDQIAEVFITAAPARTFREPGIEFPGISPFPVWDGNPEVFELDPDKLGLPNQFIAAGSSFSAVGVMGFEFSDYELWPIELTVDPAPLPRAVRPREAGEFTVGSLNLFRLFDDADDLPTTTSQGGTRDDFVVSTDEYQRRLSKFATYIIEVLDAPDILAVQEAEKLGVLTDLATKIAAVYPGIIYSAELIEGNDVGTIDVGYLVRDSIVDVTVTQIGAEEILALDGSLLHDRPPLLLEGRCIANGLPGQPVRVLNVHMRSLNSIETERTRQKRLEQAESVAAVVQDLQTEDTVTPLTVVGDFNAFEFSDAYVDLVGHIKGDFVASDNLVCQANPCTDLVDPNLTNQVLSLPAEDRYSFIFRGNAQVLDHALTTAATDALVRGFEYGRGNADAAVDLINDDSTPLRSSDHDGFVMYLVKDSDQDGVTDDIDFCPETVIPESMPTKGLGRNRWALVDGDGIFDTNGGTPKLSFTVGDTAGCSCEQIIAELGLGKGHTKFGCSNGVMREWVERVSD